LASKRLGVPCVILNAESGTTALTLPLAPETFWQEVQWQARRSETGALMAKRMAPQRQLPVSGSGMAVPPEMKEGSYSQKTLR
jgi:hypothetical protein